MESADKTVSSFVGTEQDPNSRHSFSPTQSSVSLRSNESMTSNEDGSSLKYISMEKGYVRKDGRPYDKKEDRYDHWHRNGDCELRQASGYQLFSEPNFTKNEEDMQSYSSGYNSGLKREKIYIEMQDEYDNELRRPKPSDCKMSTIKDELIKVAEKWKASLKKANFKIFDMSDGVELTRLPQDRYHDPVGASRTFMVRYY